ncbi:hypothetical protein [Tenacibaculum finnmarkense]|uniref:hypothetical protein n=1 Tax=Tenacibaculum finnmarkense TaxID=2781243 RepID=UPI001E3CAEC0|nr:hypothetical protein [Tenacibaculum finnmarkense]MCD8415735.1 hypothetical protein [Tenacibaculum dicentrarchi]MCD8420859.1 hypothetical protein [Tenacibaculum dicentrarchi]MCD8436025.1 hypothetical protein [Tenacibaculum dicentrarchi]MCG8208438.1 hypothetical protein [Tenacibaculum finnmarkense genomovar finnmarkense]MCG8724379.1 hypothetical protein [Tenacibaculum finnmarkense]
MNTITLGETKYNEILKPLNLIYLKKFTTYSAFTYTLMKHKEGFEYSHGITRDEELKELVGKGETIYIKDSDQDDYDIKTKYLIKEMAKFLSYNEC